MHFSMSGCISLNPACSKRVPSNRRPSEVCCLLCRDAQHLTAMRLTPEETNQLRMATVGPVGAYNQRLQQQAVSATAGLPVLGSLPNPNDLPLLPTSTTAGMLIGLNRTMSLPRPGLPGLGLAAVSNMGSVGLGTMLPPGGVNMGSSATFPSCSISGQFMAQKTRDNLQQFRVSCFSLHLFFTSLNKISLFVLTSLTLTGS